MSATIEMQAPPTGQPEGFNNFDPHAKKGGVQVVPRTHPDIDDPATYAGLADEVENFVRQQTPEGQDLHILTEGGEDIRGQGAASFDKKLQRLETKPEEFRAVINRNTTPTNPGQSKAMLMKNLLPPPPEVEAQAQPERANRRSVTRAAAGRFALMGSRVKQKLLRTKNT